MAGFIYGADNVVVRDPLREDLKSQSIVSVGLSQILSGDFSFIRFQSGRLGGSPSWAGYMVGQLKDLYTVI